MSGSVSATGRVGGIRRLRGAASMLLSVACLAISATAFGQSSETLRMLSSGQAGGGGRSQGGTFSLVGTIGQTVAAPMQGGAFLVRSGFVPMCPDDLEPGDIDGDSSVGGGDLGILLMLYGPCPDPFSCPGDLDNNGEVDGGDLGLLLMYWH